MATLDLSKYGIKDVKEVLHNPSYDVLFAEETKPGLEGFEKGQVTELGAVNVMTGVYTGRSPKDKFFVKNEASENSVWWTSEEYKNDNKPCSEEAWADLKAKAVKELSGKRLFVVDTFCGANEATRMKVRFIMEVAWQAHFVTNMFIRPTAEELANYGEPDFVCFNASKAKVDNYKELGLNSETATVFNLKTKEQVILNTWYGGEMKKGMFSIMNYKNPLRGIASMHCSANTNMEGTDSAIFFGLSGTGKTTLSTDPKRLLIGDDEHGWDDEGVFNYEGGCYAKVINLDKESEPDIYNAIKRDALLENLHRVALNPLEEAAAYQQMIDDFGLTQAQLSKSVSKSRPQIANTLRLLNLPATVQKKVASGLLSAGHARALLGLPTEADMEQLATRIISEGLSVRSTEEIVSMKVAESDQPKKAKTNKLNPWAGTPMQVGLEKRFGTKVSIKGSKEHGRIEIVFKSEDDMKRIVDLLMPTAEK